MTEFNSEADAYISNFLNNPPEDRERKLQMAQRTCQLLVDNRTQIEGVKSLNNYYMGAFIASLKVDELWRSFPGNEEWWQFGDFCANKLGFSLPKANTLERVWGRAKKANMTPEEVESLGWATADRILRFCATRHDVDFMLMEVARYETKQEFLETLRGKNNGHEDHATIKHKTQFIWSKEEHHTVNSILEEIATSYGKQLGKNMRPEEALLTILVQWKQAAEEGRRHGMSGK